MIYHLVYVDDILIAGNDQHAITNLIQNLNKEFALEDLGELNYFLGIQVSSFPNASLHLSQRKYIIDLLIRAKLQYAEGINTPVTNGHKLTTYGRDTVHNVYTTKASWEPYSTSSLLDQNLHTVLIVCQFMQAPLKHIGWQ